MEKIVLEFLFGDLVRGFTVELGKHADGAGVGFLGAFPFAIELQGLDRFVIPIGHHDTSPFSIRLPLAIGRGLEVSY